MRSLLAALALVPLAVRGEVSFDDYCLRYGKAYGGGEEHARRQALFEQRVAEVAALNARPGRSWTAGVNAMTDLSTEEMRGRLGYVAPARDGDGDRLSSMASPSSAEAGDLPREVDWRRHTPAVVAPVRDQGSCGSCWAFSAAATIESALALATGVLLELSPQQLTSCTPNPQHCGGQGGCTGANQQQAFNYTVEHGLTTIWKSPYHSGLTGDTGTCMPLWEHRRVAGITGYRQLPLNDGPALRRAVATAGPVSVSVAASSWYLYSGGIFDHCSKTSIIIDHAVVLDGYGEEAGVKYWLIRNSWSTDFGEDGYIRLRRYDEERCAWDTDPLQGSGCEGGPAKLWVCGECGVLSDSSYPTGAFLEPRDGRRLGGSLLV